MFIQSIVFDFFLFVHFSSYLNFSENFLNFGFVLGSEMRRSTCSRTCDIVRLRTPFFCEWFVEYYLRTYNKTYDGGIQGRCCL